MSAEPLNRQNLFKTVEKALTQQPVTDMHTHLYPPSFGTPDLNATAKPDPNGTSGVPGQP